MKKIIKLLNHELFGLIISMVFYSLSTKLYNKTKKAILNPLFISILGIILFLSLLNIPIEYYNLGTNYINFFLGPATIVLVIPLYKQIYLLKNNFFPILIGILFGCLTAIFSVYILSKLLGLDKQITLSLLPKSITTPIGISISETYNGIVSITVASIIITGITGSVVSPFIINFMKFKNDVAKGVAIGTSSHAVGTSKAIEMGDIIGAMSSVSIPFAGIITALIMPVFLFFITK